ncbi:MAG: protein kinase [Verrucomicrobia bacterium]|nr:protein kinase [Verrucomicrobiota bacterium]
MSDEISKSVREIFADALDLPDPARRDRYLDQACGGDAQLRWMVESLLKAHQEAGAFMQSDGALRAEDLIREGPGTLIGRYKLLQQIGEGGFGLVFMAEQREPVQRMVALKIIKAGMDTREVIARFEAERQALAMMDHPNIARVLDAGATESGRPYFVMELVRGIPITDYSDRHHLPTEERLHLFIQVCQAVEHAHQKGVIHRDLKPANILITTIDGRPVPKVIDFGIVKAIGQRLTTKTLFTRFEEFIGTPAYMSPEQAEFSGVDVDTRSDIYALGVLLYELLTGRTPFDQETLRRAGLDEMRRIIRETEPARPSAFLRGLGDTLREIADRRHADPNTLARQLEGDLDWIVMKCLEKDRARRYATASTLALDVQRHLNHEPVAAGPPTKRYRARKFVRRHRMGVALAASVSLALMLGFVLAALGFVRASRERDRALAAEKEADEGRREAIHQRQRAEAGLRRLELQGAQHLFARGQSARALSVLASLLRQNPNDPVAAEWLMNELMHRNYALPAIPPLLQLDLVTSARFSPDGRRILTAARDNTACVWDAATSQPVTAPLRHDPTRIKPGEFMAGVHPLVAAFSPDGRRVATGSIDGAARIWDAAAGVPLTAPMLHSNWISWVVFSPDGSRVATACKDGVARLWDSLTGKPLGVELQHDAWINSVEFSPDGLLVVTASDARAACIWETATGKPAGPPLRHQREVNHAVFSPDGRKVATASVDGRAQVWDARTGQALGQPLAHASSVLRVAFSPDGSILATASWDKTARLWNVQTAEPVGQPFQHDDVVRDVRFSPDGHRVATASRDKTARVWDVHTREPITEPIRHHDAVWTAEFSPDGKRLLTASADRTAQVWDVRPSRALVHVLPHTMRIISVDWSADGRRVLAVSPGEAHVWDAETGQPTEGPAMASLRGIRCARFSPDGNSLVLAMGDGTAQVLDGRGQQSLSPHLAHQGAVLDAAFSPDGRLIVTASDDRSARVWDCASGQPRGESLRHNDSVRTARFSPDGQTVVTASADHTARLWNAATSEPRSPALKHDDVVVSAQFSPTGEQIVTASWDHSARVWDAGSGTIHGSPLRHTAPVLSAQFSPDGKWVVTASADETARIWDWRSGQPVGKPLAHEGRVNWAAFCPDSRRVLTASVDGNAGLWDAHTGFRLATGLRHRTLVEHAQFSPDGHRIATAPFDYQVRIWEIADARLPAPTWLAELAETVAGEWLDSHGVPADVPAVQYFELKSRLQSLPADDTYASWARRFITDRVARP